MAASRLSSILPASSVRSPATVEGTAMGTIEAVVPASGFFIGLEPRFQVFDAPGLFTDMAHAQRVFADPEVRKQLSTLGGTKGVEPIAILPHGPLMLLSHKPIRAVADFDGQKIRVPGAAPLQIEPFKKLGASPVSMPLGEVLSAMQNRTIDGLIASAHRIHRVQILRSRQGTDLLARLVPDRACHGQQELPEIAWTGTRAHGPGGGVQGAAESSEFRDR